MYWWNIKDILEKESAPLTAQEIYLKHHEYYGHGSKRRIVIVLKKLVVANQIEVKEISIPYQRGRCFIYSLKK